MASGGSGALIDAGYFARRVMARPADLAAYGVVEICSVSECLSPGADGWIESWLHNDLLWFNRLADALSVVPVAQRADFRVFAYRIHPQLFRGHERVAFALPGDVQPEPLPAGFTSIGFDSVGRAGTAGFDCSPLSCNGLAEELPVNEHCLFPTLDAALAAAQRFAVEQPEPGDYYVVEVLERPRSDPDRATNAESGT